MTTTDFAGVSLNLAQYGATVEKIAKINERAAKRGLAGRLVVEHGEQYTQRVCDHNEHMPCLAAGDYLHHYEQRVDVAITGEAPKFAGWTFAARVDAVGDSFTLATAPGVEHVSRDGLVLGQCDHCQTNRARKTTYVLVNEQGTQVQVGSTCIKDFLGWEGNIAWLDAPEVSDEWLGGSFYVAPEYKVFDVARLAITSVRMRGFVSTQVWDQQSTREHVFLVFRDRLNDAERAVRDALVAEAKNTTDAEVEALLAFLVSDDFAGTSTYVDNMKVIASQEYITGQQFGLLASAPQAYAKHLGLVEERKARKASEHIGTEGEKVTVTVTISNVKNTGSFRYGAPDSYLVTGRTANDEIVKFFTTAGWVKDAEVGDSVTLTGTVKDHEVYGEHEVKSTMLARVKVVK